MNNNDRASNFGRMGRMLVGNHDNFNAPNTMKAQMFEEDKNRNFSRNRSKGMSLSNILYLKLLRQDID